MCTANIEAVFIRLLFKLVTIFFLFFLPDMQFWYFFEESKKQTKKIWFQGLFFADRLCTTENAIFALHWGRKTICRTLHIFEVYWCAFYPFSIISFLGNHEIVYIFAIFCILKFVLIVLSACLWKFRHNERINSSTYFFFHFAKKKPLKHTSSAYSEYIIFRKDTFLFFWKNYVRTETLFFFSF